MQVIETKTNGVVTIALAGRLDTLTAKAFEERILGQIQSGERRFVADLAELDYISSAGLRVFLLAAKRLEGGDGRIVVCSLKGPVKEVFEIAGFASMFCVCDSRDEAVQAAS